jgi:hypothetical protein
VISPHRLLRSSATPPHKTGEFDFARLFPTPVRPAIPPEGWFTTNFWAARDLRKR